MLPLIYKYNGKFFIDKTQLSVKVNKDDICNDLYLAIYSEFLGAAENPLYRELTFMEKMQKVNDFAHEWLRQRGLE
jgi:hypothetical protein